MGEYGSTATGDAALHTAGFTLPAAPIAQPLYESLAVLLLVPILLSVAAWNGFPIIFYDTGAYMLQGLGHVFVAERSPIYSTFLNVTGGAVSLWLVALAQCTITAFVMTQFARALRPQMSLWILLAIGAVLCLATGLPWYAAQIEPDCFVAIVPLTLYLLAFHDQDLGGPRKPLLFAAAAIAIACHPSHIPLASGLLAAIAALRFAPRRFVEANGLPRPRVMLGVASLCVAIVAIFAANYAFTRHVFFSRSGMIFLEARIMEDGLIKPVLDADCAGVHYDICPYKDHLPARADTWLWMVNQSPFKKLGGFEKRGREASLLVHESLTRYPLENAIVALEDGLLQFFWFQTATGSCRRNGCSTASSRSPSRSRSAPTTTPISRRARSPLCRSTSCMCRWRSWGLGRSI
ncbi:MAG: hypothetical protein WDN03_14980 [Rhizomicrobium sp.]